MYCLIRRTPEYYKKVINTIVTEYYGRIDRLNACKTSIMEAGKTKAKIDISIKENF